MDPLFLDFKPRRLDEDGTSVAARVSQIMDLLNLAPSVQEEVFKAPSPSSAERRYRNTVRLAEWRSQLGNRES